jgi:hypothetical protein
MITRNGKLTTWEDTLENLLEAAREAAFSSRNEAAELVSDRHDARIVAENGTARTEDKRLIDLALQSGWWIEQHPTGGWEILFNWPKDPAQVPSNNALHITRTVIPLSEAERRWHKANLRQSAYKDKLLMWKAGPRAWFTTIQAMEALFGPESAAEAASPPARPRSRSPGATGPEAADQRRHNDHQPG